MAHAGASVIARAFTAFRPFIKLLGNLLYGVAVAPLRYAAVLAPFDYVALLRPRLGNMPGIIPPLPAMAPDQVQTMGMDFGLFLPSGVTLTGTPTLTLGVASGTDPDPQSHLSFGPTVGTLPTAQGGSGVTDTAIIFQISGAIGEVTYSVEGVCTRSDGDRAEGWVLLPCISPPNQS